MTKHILHLAITLAVAAQTTGAWAATPANAQLAADNKAALARYDSDKKLCNDETSSNARLQCRRDAKAEYDQASSRTCCCADCSTRLCGVWPRVVHHGDREGR